jgi:hypothetical protein
MHGWAIKKHGLDLGEAITFPLIVFFVLRHEPCTQMSFCPKTPNLGVLKWGFLWLWRPITSRADLQLKWGLKKSGSPCRKFFNNMWHATRQVNQSDSWLLVVRSQIGNLTPDPSFGHNLCFKYSNGSCKPILDIYVSRVFQWYNEFFNPISFGPWNCLLKIQKSSKTPTLKMGTHLGMCEFIPSHFLTFLRVGNVIPELHFWLTPLQAFALIASPRLGLR